MSMRKRAPRVFNDGRTKQSFKDSTDINKILARASKQGTLSHLEQFGGEYADFSDMPDLLEAHNRLARAQEVFDRLPGEIRREFHQDPAAFYSYVSDPANSDRLRELLPALAKPGTQMPQVRRRPEAAQGSEATETNTSAPVAEQGAQEASQAEE